MSENERPVGRLPHPGQHLADYLAEIQMDEAEFSRRVEMPRMQVRAIIAGMSSIELDVAMRFGKFFGQSPQFWMNLQVEYDLREAMHHSITQRILQRIRPYQE